MPTEAGSHPRSLTTHGAGDRLNPGAKRHRDGDVGKHENAASNMDVVRTIEPVGQQKGPAKDEGEPPLPRMLSDRYRLDSLIAKGGMGRVYLATQLPLERRVALKLLVTPAMNEDFRRRFFLEASVLARLSHPNIVVVHDYGEAPDGSLFMVMEYLDGTTLLDTLRSGGRLPAFRVLQITAEVCRALRASHRQGIAHRDLKPGNVMLLPNKEDENRDIVKVLDFGLVKVFQEQQEIDLERDLTRAEMMLGSPRYMAPEQIQCENVDARVDVYSLGVVLFSMLVGRPPFVGTTLEILNQHLETDPPGINEITQQIGGFSVIEPDVCVVLDSIVRRCMRKEPAERYQSMDELLVDLREAYGLIADDSLDPHSTLEIVRPGASAPPPLTLGSTPPPLPMEAVSLEEENTTKRSRPETPISAPLVPIEPPSGNRRTLILLLASFAAILCVGLLIAGLLAFRRPAPVDGPGDIREDTPSAPTVSVPSPTSEQPAPSKVVFTSEPSGAQVLRNDEVLGRTPMDLEVPPSPNGEETSYLFRLSGHEDVTVGTVVRGDSVSVHADLLPTSPPSAPTPVAEQPPTVVEPALPPPEGGISAAPIPSKRPGTPVRPPGRGELQPGDGTGPVEPSQPEPRRNDGERPRAGGTEAPAPGSTTVDEREGSRLIVDDRPSSVPVVD